MKKKLIKLSLLATLLLLVFIIAFVVTNLFDAPEPEGVYTMNDLVQTSLGSDNGYYLLMALSYPTNMDITSPEVFTKIRKFSDPGLLSLGSKEIHKRAKIHNNLYKKLKIKGETGLIYKFTENLKKINSEKDKIEEFLNSNQVLMQRYRQLLESEKIEDFSLPTYSYPIPHLVNVIKATNLYTARQILNVLDDRWDDGIQGILKQISFYRKLGRSSRQLVNKAVSLRMINHSLKALVFIMNRKDCPKTVFSTILNGLTPLKEQEISMRNPILFEFLNATQGIQEILTSEEPPFAPISVLSAGFWPNKVDWYNFLAKFR
ncbi:MAG: hypothetical protein KAT34_13275, partial [Candidatus Aminicenantes bacterium]|nr:hypothetical protein [Candidatus Aminicenantes bacterium]